MSNTSTALVPKKTTTLSRADELRQALTESSGSLLMSDDVTMDDTRPRGLSLRINIGSKYMTSPNKIQKEVVKECVKRIKEDVNDRTPPSGIAVAACGVGKTGMMLMTASQCGYNKIMYLTTSQIGADQATVEFEKNTNANTLGRLINISAEGRQSLHNIKSCTGLVVIIGTMQGMWQIMNPNSKPTAARREIQKGKWLLFLDEGHTLNAKTHRKMMDATNLRCHIPYIARVALTASLTCMNLGEKLEKKIAAGAISRYDANCIHFQHFGEVWCRYKYSEARDAGLVADIAVVVIDKIPVRGLFETASNPNTSVLGRRMQRCVEAMNPCKLALMAMFVKIHINMQHKGIIHVERYIHATIVEAYLKENNVHKVRKIMGGDCATESFELHTAHENQRIIDQFNNDDTNDSKNNIDVLIVTAVGTASVDLTCSRLRFAICMVTYCSANSGPQRIGRLGRTQNLNGIQEGVTMKQKKAVFYHFGSGNDKDSIETPGIKVCTKQYEEEGFIVKQFNGSEILEKYRDDPNLNKEQLDGNDVVSSEILVKIIRDANCEKQAEACKQATHECRQEYQKKVAKVQDRTSAMKMVYGKQQKKDLKRVRGLRKSLRLEASQKSQQAVLATELDDFIVQILMRLGMTYAQFVALQKKTPYKISKESAESWKEYVYEIGTSQGEHFMHDNDSLDEHEDECEDEGDMESEVCNVTPSTSSCMESETTSVKVQDQVEEQQVEEQQVEEKQVEEQQVEEKQVEEQEEKEDTLKRKFQELQRKEKLAKLAKTQYLPPIPMSKKQRDMFQAVLDAQRERLLRESMS